MEYVIVDTSPTAPLYDQHDFKYQQTCASLLARVRIGRVFVYHFEFQPVVAALVRRLECEAQSVTPPPANNTRARRKYRSQFAHHYVFEVMNDTTDYTNCVTKPKSHLQVRRVHVRRDAFQSAIAHLIYSADWRRSVNHVSEIPPTLWTALCAVLMPGDITTLFPTMQPWSLIDTLIYRAFAPPPIAASTSGLSSPSPSPPPTPHNTAGDSDNDDDDDDDEILADIHSSRTTTKSTSNTTAASDLDYYYVGNYKLSNESVSLLLFTITFEYYLQCVSAALPMSTAAPAAPTHNHNRTSTLFMTSSDDDSAGPTNEWLAGRSSLFESSDSDVSAAHTFRSSNNISPLPSSSADYDDSDSDCDSNDTDESIGSNDATGDRSSFSSYVPPEVLSVLDEYERSAYIKSRQSAPLPSDIDSYTITKLYHCGRFVINTFIRGRNDLTRQQTLWQPADAFTAYANHVTRSGLLMPTFQTAIAADINVSYVGYLVWLQRRLAAYTLDKNGLALSAFTGANDGRLLVQQQQIQANTDTSSKRRQALRRMQLFTHGFAADRDVNALGVSLRDNEPRHAFMVFDRTQVSPLRAYSTMRLFDRLYQLLNRSTDSLMYCIAFDTHTTKVSMPMSKYAVLKYQLIPYYLSQPNRVERLVPLPMFYTQWRQWLFGSGPLSQELSWLCSVRSLASAVRGRANTWHMSDRTALPCGTDDASLPVLALLPLIMRRYGSDAAIWNALVEPLKQARRRKQATLDEHPDLDASLLKNSVQLQDCEGDNCLLTALDAFVHVHCKHYISASAYERLVQIMLPDTEVGERVGVLLDQMAMQLDSNFLPSSDDLDGYWPLPEHDDTDTDTVPLHMCLYELCASNDIDDATAIEIFCGIRTLDSRQKRPTLHVSDNHSYDVAVRRMVRHRQRTLQLYHETRAEPSTAPHFDASMRSSVSNAAAFTDRDLGAGADALYSLMRSLYVLAHYRTSVHTNSVRPSIATAPSGSNVCYSHKYLLDTFSLVLLAPEEAAQSRMADCLDLREIRKSAKPSTTTGAANTTAPTTSSPALIKTPTPKKQPRSRDLRAATALASVHALTLDNSLPLASEEWYESLTAHYHISGVPERGERAFSHKFYELVIPATIDRPFTFSPPDLLPLLKIYPVNTPAK
jgi:hypothetical protein